MVVCYHLYGSVLVLMWYYTIVLKIIFINNYNYKRGNKMKTLSNLNISKLAIAVTVALTSLHSFAEEVNDSSEAVETKKTDQLDMETIIVTGRAGKDMKKIEASYAVTTMNIEELRARAPRSLAGALEAVPGLWVEASGGVTSNNVRARGIPLDGFRSLTIYEDGLPVQHDMAFGRAGDQSFRLDETISRVEAVRGGTSSIFASNAPGGLVNFVTRKASDKAEGLLKYTIGDYNHNRIDFWYGAPISDEWSFATGGFYREDDGIRPTGYTANEGGQFRFNLTHTTDTSTLDIGYKVINDEPIFYLPIPLTRNSKGDVASLPGFDANYGNLQSLDNAVLTYPTPSGAQATEDLRNGYHVDLQQFTVKFETELSNDWSLSNNFRFRTSTNAENTIFTGGAPVTATSFLDEQREIAIADEYFSSNGVSDVALVYANFPDSNFDLNNANGNGLVIPGYHFTLASNRNEFINDFSVNRLFEFGGQTHDFTAGIYYANVNFHQDFIGHKVLLEVAEEARLLDVVALGSSGSVATDADGNELSVTQNGVLQYSPFSGFGDSETQTIAAYVADEWQVTDDLRIDGGIRYEHYEMQSTAPLRSNSDLGDQTTLADNNYSAITQGNSGGVNSFASDTTETAFSLGANYSLNDESGVYARYVSSFRINENNRTEQLPFVSSGDALEANPTVKVDLFEVGYKLSTDNLSVFATLFYSDFKNQEFSQTPIGGGEPVSAIGNLVSQGIELEATWAPVDFFDIKVITTLMDSETSNFSDVKDLDGNVVFDGDAFNGLRPVRIPETMIAIVPGVNLLDGAIRAQLEYRYNGQRYGDALNTASTPEYFVLNGNVTVEISDDLTLALQVTNLTNEIGLTEGNPRSGELVSSDDPTAEYFLGRPILGRAFRLSAKYEF